MTTDLSPAESATVARIEAAPNAPEAWDPNAAVQRVMDLCAVAENREPAWRYVSVRDLRTAILGVRV